MTNFRYSLRQAPEARNDGSGCVAHEIWAEYEVDEDWQVVPSRNKTFCVPAADLADVLAMPDGSPKVAAYKQLLLDNINTQPVPVTGWTEAQLQAMIDANDLSLATAEDANTYITVDLGKNYPVPFNI